MNAGTEQAFESAALAQVFSDKGFSILKDSQACNLTPEFALTRIAVIAIRKTVKRGKTREICVTNERIEQIVTPLIENPKVRGRLRRAGFKVTIRSEMEFSYMMEATA